MLGEFWYNGREVCTMLGEFCYSFATMVWMVSSMLGGGAVGTMVRKFVPC